MSALAHAATGFLTALWIGVGIGFLGEWRPRILVAVLFVLGGAVVASVFAQTPEGAAESINWVVVAGTVPGYIVGPAGGRLIYRRYWVRDDKNTNRPYTY